MLKHSPEERYFPGLEPKPGSIDLHAYKVQNSLSVRLATTEGSPLHREMFHMTPRFGEGHKEHLSVTSSLVLELRIWPNGPTHLSTQVHKKLKLLKMVKMSLPVAGETSKVRKQNSLLVFKCICNVKIYTMDQIILSGTYLDPSKSK